VSASQALDAAREGSRGAGAAAGLVQMAHLQGEERITTAMQQELANRERLIIGEDARLQGLQAELSLGEVEGAQIAAANNQNMMNQATTNLMTNLGSAATTAAGMAKLYNGTKLDRQKAANAEMGVPMGTLSAQPIASDFQAPALSLGIGGGDTSNITPEQMTMLEDLIKDNPDLLSNLLKGL